MTSAFRRGAVPLSLRENWDTPRWIRRAVLVGCTGRRARPGKLHFAAVFHILVGVRNNRRRSAASLQKARHHPFMQSIDAGVMHGQLGWSKRVSPFVFPLAARKEERP
jgi:hypothetical protein